MNGRIYDPVLGRFLSADIVVQAPNAITSYNRYGYVMNNPLAYTDPSGYFIEAIAAFIAAAATTAATVLPYLAAIAIDAGLIAMATGHRTAARRFFAAAIMFATAGTPYAVIGAFAAGGVQSGSLEGAVMAGMSAGLFAAAGGIADAAMLNEAAAMEGLVGPMQPSAFSVGGIGRAGMHFGAGAVRAMMAGGDPIRGGFSAGFAEIAGPYVSGTDVGVKQFAAHVVAGGIGEVIAGGKFANGAMTGAFAWLYNHFKGKELAAFAKRGAALIAREMANAGADLVANSLYMDYGGKTAIADGVFKFPSADHFLIAEVKIGGAEYTTNQKAIYAALERGDAVTLRGQGAAAIAERMGITPNADGSVSVPAGKLKFSAYSFHHDGTVNRTRGQELNDAIKKAAKMPGER